MDRDLIHRAALLGVAGFALAGCISGGQDPEAVTRPATSDPAPSQSDPREGSTPLYEPEGTLVSAEAVLLGKWRTVELYGSPVSRQRDRNGHPLGLDFLRLSGQWWWSANDGCNTTAGRLHLTAEGAFDASGGSSTLVGCSPNWFRRGGQNVKAPQRADEAWFMPAEGDVPARLTLTAGGVTVGLYEALPGR